MKLVEHKNVFSKFIVINGFINFDELFMKNTRFVWVQNDFKETPLNIFPFQISVTR